MDMTQNKCNFYTNLCPPLEISQRTQATYSVQGPENSVGTLQATLQAKRCTKKLKVKRPEGNINIVSSPDTTVFEKDPWACSHFELTCLKQLKKCMVSLYCPFPSPHHWASLITLSERVLSKLPSRKHVNGVGENIFQTPVPLLCLVPPSISNDRTEGEDRELSSTPLSLSRATE